MGNEPSGASFNFAADQHYIADSANANNNILGTTADLTSKGIITHTRASNATSYNRRGYLENIGSNIPRITHKSISLSTSTTVNRFGIGKKFYTTSKSYTYNPGDIIAITGLTTDNYMRGKVISYNSSTGILEVDTFSSTVYGISDNAWAFIICEGYISELQVTNFCLYSHGNFTNAAWSKVGMTATDNVPGNISPSGAANMSTLIENTGPDHYMVQSNMSYVANTTYTASVFVKELGAGSKRYVSLMFPITSFPSYYYAMFDPANGNVVKSAGVTTNVTQCRNNWWRISVTCTASNTASSYIRLNLSDAAQQQYGSYTGDGVSGIQIYGFQVESSNLSNSTMSSYIVNPTGSQVTRAADVMYVDSSKIPNLNNGFTVVSNFSWQAMTNTGAAPFGLFKDTLNRCGLTVHPVSSNMTFFNIYDGNATYNSQTIPNTTPYPNKHKVALSMDANNIIAARNGTLLTFSTFAGLVNNFARLEIGYRNGAINIGAPMDSLYVIPHKISNTEIQMRTT